MIALSVKHRILRMIKNQNAELEWLSKRKKIELDVDPRRDDDASPMSLYRCMLRPTWMFIDRMIAQNNVHSICGKLFKLKSPGTTG